jgi:hypothetical protein
VAVSARRERHGGENGNDCPVAGYGVNGVVMVAARRLKRCQHGYVLTVVAVIGCGCGREEGSGVVEREPMVRTRESCAG